MPATVLSSNDDDPELLIHIPFDGQVVLKAICIIGAHGWWLTVLLHNCCTGGADGTSPSRLRAFTNRDDLDFGTAADTTPVQEWDLLENPRGEIEYPTQCVCMLWCSVLRWWDNALRWWCSALEVDPHAH